MKETADETRRSTGRPRVAVPTGEPSRVSTWIPAPQHDAAIRQARQQGTSVSGLVRALIVKAYRRATWRGMRWPELAGSDS